jgi:hypothetical protein
MFDAKVINELRERKPTTGKTVQNPQFVKTGIVFA